MTTAGKGRAIDDLMDRASEALVGTEYFEAERRCLKAIALARRAGDFERLARICLPLQEARRQKRQIAESAGFCAVVGDELLGRGPRQAGCYLVRPPMIGLQARALRDLADRRRVAALVVACEPPTREGKWPVVAVGESRPIGMVTIRTIVEPPPALGGGDAARNGRCVQAGREAPPVDWFCAAAEALGDAAIAKVNPRLPAVYRVDQLLDSLDALPDHEKLHQRLEEAARAAVNEPPPKTRLPREWVEKQYSP